MKRILLAIAILAIAVTANAWTLNWSAATGADGYNFYWRVLGDTVYTKVNVGNVLGYEFWVTAYNNGGESGMSDVWRWTMPSDPVIVELPEPPKQLIINF